MVKVKQVATKPKRPRKGAKIVGLEKASPPRRNSTRKGSTAATPPSPVTATSSDDVQPEEDPRFKSPLYREMYYKTFTGRTIYKCRHVDFDSLDTVHAGFIRQWFHCQQWDGLLIEKHPIYPDLVRHFYTHFNHANKTAGVIITWVKGKLIKSDENTLSRILKIPRGGVRAVLPGKKWSTVKEFDIQKSLNLVLDEEDSGRTKKLEIYELLLPTCLHHLILFRSFNCRNGRLSSLTYLDMLVMYFLLGHIKMNMPRMMIDYMIAIHKSTKEGLFLPYGMWLTKVFNHFEVNLSDEVEIHGPKQPFNDSTVVNALGYNYDVKANKWVKVGVKRAPKRKRDPEVQEANIGDDDEDVGGIISASSVDAVMLESIVVQQMLKWMRPDLFTNDVMSDIRESAQSIIDARNEEEGGDEGGEDTKRGKMPVADEIDSDFGNASFGDD